MVSDKVYRGNILKLECYNQTIITSMARNMVNSWTILNVGIVIIGLELRHWQETWEIVRIFYKWIVEIGT